MMRWSFKIFKIAGIEVRVHATFFLLLAFFGLLYFRSGGAAAAFAGVLFTCLVFLCVLLHEFGHALAARRYGIHTPDITLLPIGGLARLERMPEKPQQELVVALAGPLVNVVIALFLYPFVHGNLEAVTLDYLGAGILDNLFVANVILVLFNLIPAFPMDGGRVLRALLAMRLDYARATNIAASIGQGLAVVGFIVGVLHGPSLLPVVAVFIYFGAQSEAAHAQIKSVSVGLRVNAAMITQFQSLPLHATLNDAIDALLRTAQHDFPVVGPAGEVRGLLARGELLRALRKAGAETPVREVMFTQVPTLHYTMLFDRAVAILQESGCPALPVLDSAGKLVGLFTPENVGELLLVQSALAKARAHSAPAPRAEPPPLPA